MPLVNTLIGWRGYAAAALAGAVVSAGAAWTVQGWRYGAQIADLHRQHAEERDAQAQAAMAAIEAARDEERRRMAAVEKTREDAQKQAAAAAAAADVARTDAARLRTRADTLARAAVARDSTLADGSPSGSAAVDLLAYMFGRAVDRATALAAIADRSRIAGLTCERAYDAVRDPRDQGGR